jgi:hypothetical protein
MHTKDGELNKIKDEPITERLKTTETSQTFLSKLKTCILAAILAPYAFSSQYTKYKHLL